MGYWLGEALRLCECRATAATAPSRQVSGQLNHVSPQHQPRQPGREWRVERHRQQHRGEGLPISAVVYSHTHGDHWGGIRGLLTEEEARARAMSRSSRRATSCAC
jgi:phosphoribosyl 1,2-cyclic phosphodiesterase